MVSRLDNDVDDLNGGLIMKIVEPWMLEGFEGPNDDDIFIIKEKSKTNSIIVMSPNIKVKHITSWKKKKDVSKKKKTIAKKKRNKGKEIKDKSNDDKECENDQRLVAIQEVIDMMDDNFFFFNK